MKNKLYGNCSRTSNKDRSFIVSSKGCGTTKNCKTGFYVKCAREDKLDQVYKIIKEGGIEPTQFDAIENDYHQMMLAKKLEIKFMAA